MPAVIERQPDGTHLLDFKDWTPEMMALASSMFELPRRPGDTGPSTHEFGIDRVAKLPQGPRGNRHAVRPRLVDPVAA
jgi:hypothetical protein